jgi:hypothetical protein
MLTAAAAEAAATDESSEELTSSHLHVASHAVRCTPGDAYLANMNDHCWIMFCSSITFIGASRSGAGATPAIMAAVAAGLTTGPFEVGVAVTMAAGVMLPPIPMMLLATGSMGVFESPAADKRPVVEGRGSSDILAAAESAAVSSRSSSSCPNS